MSDSVGSVSVDVVPDATGWSEKLRAQLRDQVVKVKVAAETGEAQTELAATEARVNRLDGRTAKVKVKTETSALSKGASLLSKFTGALGVLPALAVAAGAALIPLGAVIGGIVAALAAPLIFAGGGVGLFAVLGGLAVKKTEEQFKAISKLEANLSKLKKGTKEYAAAQKELAAAEAALSPAQKRLQAAQGNLSGAFSKLLTGKSGTAILSVIAKGMNLLAKILPSLQPIILAVSGALSHMLGQLGEAAGSKGFAHFIGELSKQIGPDITAIGGILGDLVKGIGGLLLVLGKHFSTEIVDGISKLTGAFAGWASSREGRKGIHDFIDYFHEVGPQVADTIARVARAIGHIIGALAPLAPSALHIIAGIADALSGIPIPVLTALASAMVGITVAGKVGKLRAGLTSLGGGGTRGGAAAALAGAATMPGGIVKVYVTNPGFGGPGKGGPPGAVVAGAETAAEATAAGKVGRFAATKAGFLARGGFAGLLGEALSVPAMLSLANNKKAEHPDFKELYLGRKDFLAQYRGSTKVPSAEMLAMYGKHGYSADKARSILNIPDVKAVTSRVDGLTAGLARASRTLDLVGPHAKASFGQAGQEVAAFQAKLDAIHDKRVAVIADTAAAVRSLEALQAMRIADKNFSVTARYQQRERTVGPGGGMGHPSANGPAPAPKVDVHLDAHIDENGYIRGTANDVYNENRKYEEAHG